MPVAQPRPEIERLLAHCGLDWDDACLSFQHTVRNVATASAWQVRRPLYRHAVGRWRRYREPLARYAALIGYDAAADPWPQAGA